MVEIKKKIVGIALLILIASLGVWQLEKIDLNCYNLKSGMNEQQKEIFDLFENEIDEKILSELKQKDEELFNRVYYYLKNCKDSPIMMSTPDVVVR